MDTKKISIILSILIVLAASGWGVAIFIKGRSAKTVTADRIAMKNKGEQSLGGLNCASSTDAKIRESCFGKLAAIIDSDATTSCATLNLESDRIICEKGRVVRDAVASSSTGIKECQKLNNATDVDVCEAQVLMNLAIVKRDSKKCNLIKNLQDRGMCLAFFKDTIK